MNAIGVKFYMLFSLVLVASCSQDSRSSEISNTSKNLAHCEAVYAYSANLAQMLNNEGLAKSYLARMSNVITANFFLNLENVFGLDHS